MKTALRFGFGLLIFWELLGVLGIIPEENDFKWLGLLITAVFAWVVLEQLEFSSTVWLLTFSMIILDGASAVFLLYSRIDVWDMLMHVFGGFVIGWAAIEILDRRIEREPFRNERSAMFVIIGSLLIVIALGFGYEFLEYIIDRFFFGYPRTLVSAYDSIEDQLFNILGALLAASMYAARRRKPIN